MRSSNRPLLSRPLSLLIVPLVALAGVSAAETDEPLLEDLRARIKSEPLSLGMLFQVVADFHGGERYAGENGFIVANARVSLRGTLDRRFSYLLQANFVRSPALLDGRLGYRAGPVLVEAGQFKTPFSREFLTAASDIDFVNRSQVVSALAPGRQIGVQLRDPSSGAGWWYGAGVFNGNGIGSNGNDNDEFMYVGRVAWGNVGEDGGGISGGANGVWSEDTDANLGTTIGGGPIFSGFTGKRAVAGVDLRWAGEVLLADAEFVYGRLDPQGEDLLDLYGFQITGGWYVRPDTQVLVRFDRLETDDLALDSDLLLLGGNFWPSGATEVQLNLITPTRDFQIDRGQVLVNFQVVF